MFIWMNQRERGVWKYGFQLYTGMSGYPILDRAKTLLLLLLSLLLLLVLVLYLYLFSNKSNKTKL